MSLNTRARDGVSSRLFVSAGQSYREQQCEEFNGLNLNTNRLGSSVTWVPKYSGVSQKDRCKLICRANGTGYFYVLAPKVRTRPERRAFSARAANANGVRPRRWRTGRRARPTCRRCACRATASRPAATGS